MVHPAYRVANRIIRGQLKKIQGNRLKEAQQAEIRLKSIYERHGPVSEEAQQQEDQVVYYMQIEKEYRDYMRSNNLVGKMQGMLKPPLHKVELKRSNRERIEKYLPQPKFKLVKGLDFPQEYPL